jgi:hypothetical protein
VSPALTFASAASLMLVAPAAAGAASVVCVAALPTEVTVANSVLPPRSMLIFWPTANPSVLCTGRLVVPAGKIQPGSGGHIDEHLVAGAALFRRS